MEDLNADGRSRARIPCFHVFHRGCLDRWVETQRRGGDATTSETPCPVCRINFRGDRDVVVEDEGRSDIICGDDEDQDALLAHALQHELRLEEERRDREAALSAAIYERQRVASAQRQREEETEAAAQRRQREAAAAAASSAERERAAAAQRRQQGATATPSERAKADRAKAVEKEKGQLHALQRMAQGLREEIQKKEEEHDSIAMTIETRKISLLPDGAFDLPLFGDSRSGANASRRYDMKRCKAERRECQDHLRRVEEEAGTVARNLRALESMP